MLSRADEDTYQVTSTPEEGGHASYDAIAAQVPKLTYEVFLWRSQYKIQHDAWKGTLPRCNHLDEHIIRKPSLSRFQIPTHLNPTPLSLF